MNELWEDVTLEQVANDVTVGHVGTMADQYVEVGIPFLRSLNVEPFTINTNDLKHISREFHARLNKSALKPGDIVIVRTGKPGSCAVIPDWLPEANCSDVVVVRASSKVRPSFISFVVNSSAAHHINAHTVGAVQQHFNVGSARQIRFRLPPIAEQDRILGVLGALNDKIELNRRMNETLEATARAIFKDWFVDFGPTRAKIEGRAPYLAAEVWSLFPDALDNDSKPAGWLRVPLAALIEVNPSESLPRGKHAPYLDMASIPTTGPNPEPYVLRDFGSGMRFRNGDALLARITPCLENGKTAFVQNLPEGQLGWGSTEFIVLRSRRPIPKPFAYLVARDPVFRAGAIRSMTGTSGRQRVSHDAVSAYPMVQPVNNDLWNKLSSIIDPMFERIAANGAESQTLAVTRDFLVPKLMSGEVRVKDAEKLVGGAT
jgi:type I restriction enzyme S subunit